MEAITLVGIAASIGTGISMLPQLIKIIKAKEAKDISLLMLSVLIAGVSLWIWYGIMRKDLIIIISNSFSASISLLILFFAIRYKK